MRVLAEDTGNPQPPTIAETDSQTVSQTAQDFTGRALTFRHRRHQLVFIISCVKAYLITVRLVESPRMTSDGLKKDYGPLEHWRRLPYLLGEQPEITRLQQIINHRYGGRKRKDAGIEELPQIDPLIPFPSTPPTSSSKDVASMVLTTSTSPYQHRRGRKGKSSKQRDYISRSVSRKK